MVKWTCCDWACDDEVAMASTSLAVGPVRHRRVMAHKSRVADPDAGSPAFVDAHHRDQVLRTGRALTLQATIDLVGQGAQAPILGQVRPCKEVLHGDGRRRLAQYDPERVMLNTGSGMANGGSGGYALRESLQSHQQQNDGRQIGLAPGFPRQIQEVLGGNIRPAIHDGEPASIGDNARLQGADWSGNHQPVEARQNLKAGLKVTFANAALIDEIAGCAGCEYGVRWRHQVNVDGGQVQARSRHAAPFDRALRAFREDQRVHGSSVFHSVLVLVRIRLPLAIVQADIGQQRPDGVGGGGARLPIRLRSDGSRACRPLDLASDTIIIIIDVEQRRTSIGGGR